MKRYRIFLMAKPGDKWKELPELDIKMFNEVFKEWNKRHFEGTLQTECQTREDMDAVLNDIGNEEKPGNVFFVMEVK